MVLIAFDNFENLIESYKSLKGCIVKEEQIEEIVIEPIVDDENYEEYLAESQEGISDKVTA